MEADTRISQEAAEWLVRLEEDESAQCRSEFFEWLKQSAWHLREFLLVTEEWRGLDGMDAAKRIDVRELVDHARRNVVRLETDPPAHAGETGASERRYPRRWLAAAAVGALVLAASWFAWRNVAPRSYATGIGEQRSFQLSDGSVLHLNARTRVEVSYSEQLRHLQLVEGEALFVVVRDPARPFRVSAGVATIQALGTQFNVYRHGGGATVAVIEGKVQVSSSQQPVILDAGEQAKVNESGRALKQAAPDISKAVAWRQRQLVFHDQPLAEVAAEFNRYNRLQIEVQGDAASAKELIGVFDVDDPQSLVRFLEKDSSLVIEREGERLLIRGTSREGG